MDKSFELSKFETTDYLQTEEDMRNYLNKVISENARRLFYKH